MKRQLRVAILSFGFLLSFFDVTVAQVTQQFTNYRVAIPIFNPAYAGINNAFELSGIFRTQWVGIGGNPILQTISVSSPLTVANSSAGLNVVHDVLGQQRDLHIFATYAYKQKARFGDFSFGVSLGFIQKSIDGSRLRSPQGSYDGELNHNDPYLPNVKVSGMAPDAHIGVIFKNEKLLIGVSATNILEGKVKLPVGSLDTETTFGRSYTLNAGYLISISPKFSITPSFLLKSDFKQFQTDITTTLQFKNNIYGGLSFRGYNNISTDALAVLAGFRLFKGFSLGYSYDFSLPDINRINAGSHELFLNYQLLLRDRSKPGKVIYNPRNL